MLSSKLRRSPDPQLTFDTHYRPEPCLITDTTTRTDTLTAEEAEEDAETTTITTSLQMGSSRVCSHQSTVRPLHRRARVGTDLIPISYCDPIAFR